MNPCQQTWQLGSNRFLGRYGTGTHLSLINESELFNNVTYRNFSLRLIIYFNIWSESTHTVKYPCEPIIVVPTGFVLGTWSTTTRRHSSAMCAARPSDPSGSCRITRAKCTRSGSSCRRRRGRAPARSATSSSPTCPACGAIGGMCTKTCRAGRHILLPTAWRNPLVNGGTSVGPLFCLKIKFLLEALGIIFRLKKETDYLSMFVYCHVCRSILSL